MYFATLENGLVISFGPDEYEGSHYTEESSLPDGWIDIFRNCRLGYLDGEFFVFSEEDIQQG